MNIFVTHMIEHILTGGGHQIEDDNGAVAWRINDSTACRISFPYVSLQTLQVSSTALTLLSQSDDILKV